MKKSFMFVAVAAAGMMASCSSDSLIAGSDPTIEPTTQEELVPIEISVATPMARSGMTRGTGTVGGVTLSDKTTAVNNDGTTGGAANAWAGQTVKVYMFEKGTLNVAKFKTTSIFDNAEMVTPTATNSGLAYQMEGGRKLVKYYPMSGAYDFWGYRIDDAKNAAGTAPAGDPSKIGEKYQVEIKVDGTQDVLGAKTVATPWANLTDDQKTAFETEDNYKSKLYSASAARQNIQPELEFNHLMTRLTFEAYPGNDNAKTVKVIGIKVRPIKSIEGTDTTYVTNIGTLDIAGTGDFTQKITWGSAAGPLTASDQYQYELKQRAALALGKDAYSGIAANAWYALTAAATDNNQFITKAAYDAIVKIKSDYTVLAAGSWYSSNADPTNVGAFISQATHDADPVTYAEYTAIPADSWYALTTAVTDNNQFITKAAYDALPDHAQGEYTLLAADSWYSLNTASGDQSQFISATTYTGLPATTNNPLNTNLANLDEVSMNVSPSNDESKKVAIGEAIIAPDAKAYELEIDLKQKVAKYEDSTTDPTDPNYATDWQEYEFGVVKTVVRASSASFEVGKSYDFIIKVYGLEKIEVKTVLKPWIWEEGNNITIATE